MTLQIYHLNQPLNVCANASFLICSIWILELSVNAFVLIILVPDFLGLCACLHRMNTSVLFLNVWFSSWIASSQDTCPHAANKRRKNKISDTGHERVSDFAHWAQEQCPARMRHGPMRTYHGSPRSTTALHARDMDNMWWKTLNAHRCPANTLFVLWKLGLHMHMLLLWCTSSLLRLYRIYIIENKEISTMRASSSFRRICATQVTAY